MVSVLSAWRAGASSRAPDSKQTSAFGICASAATTTSCVVLCVNTKPLLRQLLTCKGVEASWGYQDFMAQENMTFAVLWRVRIRHLTSDRNPKDNQMFADERS